MRNFTICASTGDNAALGALLLLLNLKNLALLGLWVADPWSRPLVPILRVTLYFLGGHRGNLTIWVNTVLKVSKAEPS